MLQSPLCHAEEDSCQNWFMDGVFSFAYSQMFKRDERFIKFLVGLQWTVWSGIQNIIYLHMLGMTRTSIRLMKASYLCIGLSYLSFLTWSHFTKSVIIFSLQVFLGSLGLKVHEKWINYGEFSNSVILYYVPSFLAKCIEFQLVAFTIKLIIFPLETTICGCLTSWKVHHDKLRASDQILIWNNREIPSF